MEFKEDVKVKSHGTAQANVSSEGILSAEVIVPPRPLINMFNRFCSPLLNRILGNHGECRTLAALRDTLLPRLISGKLRREEAKRIVQRSG
jgi:type I restriction enzyme S subunit